MKFRSIKSFVSVAAASLTIALVAQAKLENIGGGDVGFMAVGPGGLNINGSVSGFSAKENGGKVDMEVDLKSIKTGIGLRDDHTKKALNVAQNPKAKFQVERSALKFPEDQKTLEGQASGQMTINGKSKSVPFSYKVKRTGSDYHVQGLATVKYTDFIEEQCYLGVCVKDDVKIKVKFKLRDK